MLRPTACFCNVVRYEVMTRLGVHLDLAFLMYKIFQSFSHSFMIIYIKHTPNGMHA